MMLVMRARITISTSKQNMNLPFDTVPQNWILTMPICYHVLLWNQQLYLASQVRNSVYSHFSRNEFSIDEARSVSRRRIVLCASSGCPGMSQFKLQMRKSVYSQFSQNVSSIEEARSFSRRRIDLCASSYCPSRNLAHFPSDDAAVLENMHAATAYAVALFFWLFEACAAPHR